jgi:hypothetical protein
MKTKPSSPEDTMSKTSKIVIGVSTLVPAAYIVAMIGFISAVIGTGLDPDAFVGWLFAGNLSIAAFLLVQTIFFIAHAAKNRILSDGGRCIWVVVLFKLAPIAAPAYWYLYMWRRDRLGFQPAR